MAYECSVVGDLLPLYLENMVGDETKAFVEAHLAGCPSCRAALKKLEMPVEPVPTMAAVPLKKLKNKLKRKWVQVAAFTTVLVAALLVSAFAILTAPRYFPYMDGLVQVSESEGGKALLTFGEGVTGYTYASRVNGETGIEVYRVSAWTTIWDRYFSYREKQNMLIPDPSQKPVAVYYAQNNGEEDVFIHGRDLGSEAAAMALPRLVLGYYFISAAIAALLLTLALLAFRKKAQVKHLLQRVLLLPLSYILAHLCTKGFVMKTYSLQRDLALILLLTGLLYLALCAGIRLFRALQKDRGFSIWPSHLQR